MNPILKYARHLLAGLLSSMWNGGIGALAGIFGIDGASLTGAAPQARILNMHEMASAFVGACILHGIFWLKSHPLPETYDTAAPFFPAAKPQEPNPKIPNLPTE